MRHIIVKLLKTNDRENFENSKRKITQHIQRINNMIRCEGAKDENKGSGLCCWVNGVSFFSDKELEKNQIAKDG